MMIVAQSLSNLRGAYGPEGAQNFLANCRLQLFMAPADSETPDYVSKAIGNFTRKSRSKSWNIGQFGKSNIQEREEGARLLRPEDLRGLSADDCVLLIQDSDPVLANKVIYYEDRYLKSLFQGQSGDLPLPSALNVKPTAVAAVKNEAGSQKGYVIPQTETNVEKPEDISMEDFKVMKSTHLELLARVKAVKDKVVQ